MKKTSQKNNHLMVKSFSLLILFFIIAFNSLGQDDPIDGNGIGSHGQQGNPKCRLMGSGNSNNGNLGYSFGLGLEVNQLKSVSYLAGVEYKITNPTSTLKLSNIEIPVVLHYNFSNKLSIGTGGMYSYLLTASNGGRTIDLTNNKDFNRSGYGPLVEIEAGSKNLKLNLRYTQRFNGGVINSSAGIVDLGIRFTLGK